MKRYELMSKEEIINAMRLDGCGECIVPRAYCQEKLKKDYTKCSRIKECFLKEEAKAEKKRRCDIYSKTELAKKFDVMCKKLMPCSKCRYNTDNCWSRAYCVAEYAYEEVEVIDGKEVKHES